jgi:hypothetical protein
MFAIWIQELTTLTTAFMGGDLFNLVRESKARDLTELLEALEIRAKRPGNPKAVKHEALG